MARRAVVAALAIAGAIALLSRPLVALVLLGAALVIALDGRGIFGRGTLRAVIAFVSALWLGLAGVVATLLGMVVLPGSCDPAPTSCDGPEANFLFLPGVLLLGTALALLAWSVVEALRMRRAGHRLPNA